MWVLFFAICAVIFLNFFYSLIFYDEQKRKTFLCITVCLLLFSLSSLRSVHTGVDYLNYMREFEAIGKHSWEYLLHSRWEPGYLLVNKLMAYISTEPFFFALFTSGISIIGYGYYINKYSEDVWLSFVVFITMGFYTSTFNIMRQAFAMVVVLFAIRYLISRDLKKYLVCILIACIFHYSAMFAFLLYPFCRVKINVIYFILLLAGCFLFFNVLGRVLLGFFLQHVFDTLDFKSSTMGINMLIFLVVMTLMVISFADMDNEVDSVFVHMLVFASLLQVLALQFSMVARVVLYYSTALIIMIPNLLKRVNLDYIGKFCMYSLAVCFLLAYWYYVTSQQANHGVVIYEFGNFI